MFRSTLETLTGRCPTSFMKLRSAAFLKLRLTARAFRMLSLAAVVSVIQVGVYSLPITYSSGSVGVIGTAMFNAGLKTFASGSALISYSSSSITIFSRISPGRLSATVAACSRDLRDRWRQCEATAGKVVEEKQTLQRFMLWTARLSISRCSLANALARRTCLLRT
jgi:hypothetical protein